MLCDICKVNEATISYTEIMNGVTTQKHICSECAAKLTGTGGSDMVGIAGMSVQTGGFLASLLAGLMMNYEGSYSDGDMKKSNFVCPSCGTTYNEFVKYGKMGCHDCYRMFGFALDDFLKDYHGSVQHIGMMPKYQNLFVDIPEIKILKEASEKLQTESADDETLSIKSLEDMLKDAIEAEEYEKAADIRDMIKERRTFTKAVEHE